MARSMERHGTLNPSRERERDLVLAFQSGDAAAYDSIDHSCRPAAERICRRLLINPADVEEAVQETMVRAYQGLPRFNGSYALTAWIARIATNVCLDMIRSRSRRPQSGGVIEPNTEANGHDGNAHHMDPEELVEKVFQAEDVRSVLAALPERHRTALVLREFEGLSHRKIAEMLDTSPQRVKALIHRAKAGFRRAWKDEGPGRLAAFAPLLTPVNWVRRLFGRAPEFDYSATTSAATAASSPAVQSFVAVASERVSTALAAVVLAGTVGFAVQHAPRELRAEEEQPAVVEFVQAPSEVREAKPAIEEKDKQVRPKPGPAPAVLPSPEPSPTPEIAGDLAEDPEDGGPKNAAPAEPVLPPHPAGFTYSFTSDRTAAQPCGCGGTPQPNQSGIDVSKDGFSSYSGSLSAAISDSSGQAGWPAEIDISAVTERLDLSFTITDSFGSSVYAAQGVQGTVTEEAWGGWTYTYAGSYERRGGPVEHQDVPHRGALSATLTISWTEQRLVVASLELAETS